MKKVLTILLVITLVATFLVGCGETTQPNDNEITYEDGVYFAQEADFAGSGYKYFVVLTVDGGKITDAYWGGTNVQPNDNKRTASENGTYGMVAYGGAKADWYKQAKAAEAWLIENQDPALFDDLYTDEEGHTDALKVDAETTVSIHVSEFFNLAKEALAASLIAKGTYITPADYVATSDIPASEESQWWNYRSEFVVVNGTIVDANFNAIFGGEFNDDNAKYFKTDRDGNPDSTKPSSKVELGENYGMVAYAGAQAEWFEQAATAGAYVVENQGFDVNIDETGHSDTIAGVTITITAFEKLFNEALK